MTEIVNVKRGDSLNLLFSVVDGDGDAYALTDCTARLQIRNKSGSRVYLSATSDPADGLVIDAVAGTIAFAADFTDTEDLAPGTYYSDLEMTFSGVDRQSTETFQIKIAADITKDIPA